MRKKKKLENLVHPQDSLGGSKVTQLVSLEPRFKLACLTPEMKRFITISWLFPKQEILAAASPRGAKHLYVLKYIKICCYKHHRQFIEILMYACSP